MSTRRGAVPLSRWVRLKDLARACRAPAKRVVSALCTRRNRRIYVAVPRADLPQRAMYAEAGAAEAASTASTHSTHSTH